MPDGLEELRSRLSGIEDNIRKDHDELKPIVDLYRASKLLGKILIIIAGTASGIIALYTAFGNYLDRHFK